MSLKIGSCLLPVLQNSLGFALKSYPFVLVHFWSISCPACHGNMPHLQELRSTYPARGGMTVAVYMPRSEAELDEAKIRVVTNDLRMMEALILDNEQKIVSECGVSAVPAYFLFDAEGNLRRHALGNFDVHMIGQAVQRLFSDAPDETKE